MNSPHSSQNYNARQIHQRQDKYGDIQVLDYGHQRVLRFDHGLEQSRKDLFRPATPVHEYASAMLLGLVFAPHEHVTIFGLGGGCLARALRAMQRDMHIAAVELRQAVADVARQHFGLPGDAQFQLHVSDALFYLKQQRNALTDIIFSDMFHANSPEQIQNDVRFLRQCHRHLGEHGWLIINYHHLPEKNSAFYQQLHMLFSEVFVCSTDDGNVILFAGKSAPHLNHEQRQQALLQYQKKLKCKLLRPYAETLRLQDNMPVSEIDSRESSSLSD